jgi:hypothetical protein
MSPQGSGPKWVYTIDIGTTSTALSDAVKLADGSAVVVGTCGTGGPSLRGCAARITPDGKYAWKKWWEAPVSYTFNRAGIDEKGQLFAVGYKISGGSKDPEAPVVVRFGPDGTLAFVKVLTAITGVSTSLQVAGDGTVLSGGWRLQGGEARPFVLRFDAFGNVVYTANVGTASFRVWHSTLLSDGALVLVGAHGEGDQRDAWVARADAWGHATCDAPGGCYGKAAAACEDGNPCTVDLCGAKEGCTHAPQADASVCGTGKACKAGACQ